MKEIKGYIYVKPNEFNPSNPNYSFWDGTGPDGGPSKYWIESGYVPVCPYTIQFEPVDPKALIEGQVMCLLAKKQVLMQEFEAKVGQIDDAIANLRCLEFNPSEVVS